VLSVRRTPFLFRSKYGNIKIGQPRRPSRDSDLTTIKIGCSAAHSGKAAVFITIAQHNVHMPDQNILTLRQADQARTDFALIEDQLEFLASRLARVPTRA
jgi:hypothetical protein